jgi:hypothetical protein
MALPDEYRKIKRCLDYIDVFKSLFPPEDQKRLTFPTEIGYKVSPGAVDWQVLEQATCCAWDWMLLELAYIARIDGHRKFLRTRANQVRPFLNRRSFHAES